jgi:hypothetical protein
LGSGGGAGVTAGSVGGGLQGRLAEHTAAGSQVHGLGPSAQPHSLGRRVRVQPCKRAAVSLGIPSNDLGPAYCTLSWFSAIRLDLLYAFPGRNQAQYRTARFRDGRRQMRLYRDERDQTFNKSRNKKNL